MNYEIIPSNFYFKNTNNNFMKLDEKVVYDLFYGK